MGVLLLRLPKLEAIETDERDFVEFWSQQYEAGKYTDEEYYEPFLNTQKDLTEEAINKLFKWKTGGRGFPALEKLKEVKDRLEKLNEIRHFDTISRDNMDMDKIGEWWECARQFWRNPYVWDKFLLHIARPDIFAIFDQRAFAAWEYIDNKEHPEIWQSKPEGYLNYCDFVFGMCERTGKSPRDVDRALFSFGGFIGEWKKIIPLEP